MDEEIVREQGIFEIFSKHKHSLKNLFNKSFLRFEMQTFFKKEEFFREKQRQKIFQSDRLII